MLQKSEKIICIRLQNLVLKKVFTELILILNVEIDDVEFILFNSSDKIPVNQNGSCPSAANIGRVHAHLNEGNNHIFICARYGLDNNDIVQEIIKNPY